MDVARPSVKRKAGTWNPTRSASVILLQSIVHRMLPKVCHVVTEGKTYVVIFTGRWKFLRFQIPYLFQSLRINGGAIDKIVFMMILYDAETYNKLMNLAKVVHGLFGENVFEFDYLGYEPGKSPQWQPGTSSQIYRDVYYNLFSRIINHPYDKYFKMDDDIVYVHPGTFQHMIEEKNSSHCFMHFANIVSNWRCNYMHMEMGVFDGEGLNPRGLKFEFSKSANCGWKSPECAELCLRTFLHHYHNERLDKYMFKGLKQLTKRKRFSINLHLFDKDLINIKALLRTGPISPDDEGWWTEKYALNSEIKQPNCIVGKALVVHFSYSTTMKEMLRLNLLAEFETVLKMELGAKLNQVLWDALGFEFLL